MVTGQSVALTYTSTDGQYTQTHIPKMSSTLFDSMIGTKITYLMYAEKYLLSELIFAFYAFAVWIDLKPIDN